LDTGCIDLRKSRLLPRLLREKLGGIIGDLCCVYRLLKRYGWYSSEYFYRWLRGKIEEKFTLGKDKYTFADFKAEGFPGLYVVGADVSSHCTRVFSAESTPDVEVALAVRISMSIPLFFESIKFDYPGLGQAHIFADGGTMRNYPITMFDDPQYDHGGNFIGDVNVETLGGYLYTPESCENKKPVTNLVSYAENLFISLLDVQHDMYENNPDSKERSIEIDDQCVSPTDFHIRVGDEIYDELYKAGKTATKHYLDEYGKA
jgi:NTE family protein